MNDTMTLAERADALEHRMMRELDAIIVKSRLFKLADGDTSTANGPQIPHQRDELYFVAAGTGRYRVEDEVTAVGPGDVLFCAAHVAHGFEDISADFSVWVLFYGPQK